MDDDNDDDDSESSLPYLADFDQAVLYNTVYVRIAALHEIFVLYEAGPAKGICPHATQIDKSVPKLDNCCLLL